MSMVNSRSLSLFDINNWLTYNELDRISMTVAKDGCPTFIFYYQGIKVSVEANTTDPYDIFKALDKSLKNAKITSYADMLRRAQDKDSGTPSTL